MSLPIVRIFDVDAEEVEQAAYALELTVQAEIGRIPKPFCPGLQVSALGPVKGWRLQGGLEPLSTCLSLLQYNPDPDPFAGSDVVLLEASDLGHSGGPVGRASLRLLLEITAADPQVRLHLQLSTDTVMTAENFDTQVTLFRLWRPASIMALRVRVTLEASGGIISFRGTESFKEEFTFQTPMSGRSLSFIALNELADTMLHHHFWFVSQETGMYDIKMTLNAERAPYTNRYDQVADRTLRIHVYGARGPRVIMPRRWAFVAGTTATLSSVGVEFFDTQEPVKGWTGPLDKIAAPNEALSQDEVTGHEMRSMLLEIEATVGVLYLDDWSGIVPIQQGETCNEGCPSMALLVRPDLLPEVPGRIMLQVPKDVQAARRPASGLAQQGEVRVHMERMGLGGKDSGALHADGRSVLEIQPSDLPPSFEFLGDRWGTSMFFTPYNTTREPELDITGTGGMGVRLLPYDGDYARHYTCSLEVPYGGEFELLNYNDESASAFTDFGVEAELRDGAGARRSLEVRGPLRDVNIALQKIRFFPRPGFSGAAYLQLRAFVEDSPLVNETHVPVYVEAPPHCNASLEIDERILVEGSNAAAVGERIL